MQVLSETVEQLDGLDLIRAALRKAAPELRWTFGSYRFGGSREGATTPIGIHDRREIPEPQTRRSWKNTGTIDAGRGRACVPR
ncbi:hypothetical protein ACIOWI_38095 [Streptomyces sp. NPDC087659]|uniref:hypothetical protein n=1 Tax=Streptomyces sp. NPDC087659 TaxID=3365801 RepID=UPI00380BDC13